MLLGDQLDGLPQQHQIGGTKRGLGLDNVAHAKTPLGKTINTRTTER
jgi:hypothetical protein